MAASQGNHIAWLGAAEGGVDALGGKAASLDRLIRLGFPVPPGFCLTTSAFRSSRVAAGASAHLGDPLRVTLDGAVSRLVAQLETLGFGHTPRFAVRSSAVGEDGSVASYAGLHDTELGVPPEAVAEAVERCWASLWSPAAVAYRTRKGISPDEAAMAVVVQALVPAEAAAVAFTIHPVTGRTDQLVITTVRGLGDAMVSGEVTPDTWIVDRASLGILEYSPGDPPISGAVDEAGLRDLAELCLLVEQRIGDHVDVEAAYRGRWFLLQARPVTTRAAAAGAAAAGVVA